MSIGQRLTTVVLARCCLLKTPHVLFVCKSVFWHHTRLEGASSHLLSKRWQAVRLTPLYGPQFIVPFVRLLKDYLV